MERISIKVFVWAATIAMVLFVLTMLFTVVQFRLLRSDVEY